MTVVVHLTGVRLSVHDDAGVLGREPVREAVAFLRRQVDALTTEYALPVRPDGSLGRLLKGTAFFVRDPGGCRGCVFVHTHPSPNPLSSADVNAVGANGYSAVVALSNDGGEYSVESRGRMGLDKVFDRLFERGLLGRDRDKYRWLTMLGRHLALREMDRRGLISYEARPGRELARYSRAAPDLVAGISRWMREV